MEEAWLKWADLAKELSVLSSEVKKVSKLKANVIKLKNTISNLRNTHQTEIERLYDIHLAEIEGKEAFCEAEKVQVLLELQASYNAKLLGVYQAQFEQGSWFGCVEAKRIAHGDLE